MGWRWWAGENEEWMTVGPCATRDDVIAEATDARLGEFESETGRTMLGFTVVEARTDPLRLADWLVHDEVLVFAEDALLDSDRVNAEFDEGPWFEASEEQQADLIDRLKRACDEWQEAHGLVFAPSTFSATRSQEHVTIDPSEAAQ